MTDVAAACRDREGVSAKSSGAAAGTAGRAGSKASTRARAAEAGRSRPEEGLLGTAAALEDDGESIAHDPPKKLWRAVQRRGWSHGRRGRSRRGARGGVAAVQPADASLSSSRRCGDRRVWDRTAEGSGGAAGGQGNDGCRGSGCDSGGKQALTGSARVSVQWW